MKQETLKLFLENYNNEGLCSALKDFEKIFEKKFAKAEAKTIKYFPWAVIERLFRMQGGTTEVVNFAFKVDFHSKDMTVNPLTSELQEEETISQALFIHLKGTWQGETLDEYYPIFDNQNAKIIKTPNAMQLNTARQRGMVRLIARLSGIGLSTFEQQDEDGADRDLVVTQKTPTPKKEDNQNPFIEETPIKAAVKTKVTPATKAEEEPQLEIKPATSSNFFEEFLTGAAIEPKRQSSTPVTLLENTQELPEEYSNDTEEYAEKLLEIKKLYNTDEKRRNAKAFIVNKGKEIVSDLTYSELLELQKALN